MDELKNRQNAESDGLRNFRCVETEVYLNHAVILCVLVVYFVRRGGGGPRTFVDPNHVVIH